MNRRTFLSWLGLGAVSVVIPAPIKAALTKTVPRWGHFVVDPLGGADFTTIQAALDALPSGGGIIHLQGGPYQVHRMH